MAPYALRIVVYPEVHRTWTARALEHDLAAEARTIESAIDTLVKMVRAHIAYDRRHNRKPLVAFRAAPGLYWNAFRQGTRLPTPINAEWVEQALAPEMIVNVVAEHPAMRHLPPVAARTA